MTEKSENHFQQNKVVYLIYLLLVLGIVGLSSYNLYQFHRKSYHNLSTEVINLRTGPGITYYIESQVDGDSSYRIMDQVNNWYYVLLDNNQVGWMPTWLTDSSSNTNNDFIATTLVDEMTLYEENSEEANVLGSVEKNSKYQILYQADGWVQLQLDGQTGWVDQSDIDITPGTLAYQPTSDYTEEDESNFDNFLSDYDYTVTSIADGANIRDAANTDSNIIDHAEINEQFAYLGQENEYYHIRTVDGTEGYIVNWLSESDSTAMAETAEAAEPSTTLSGRTVVLDPGHGGTDPGAVTEGLYEKEVTLETALAVKERLEAAGVNVILTRDSDTDVPLDDIAYTANQAEADLLISFHYDATEGVSATGTTVYYYGDDSIPVAEDVQAQLMEQLPLDSNGIKFGDFQVIRERSGEGLLLELGYMSNPNDVATFSEDEYWDQVANAIYNGLVVHYQ